jgi:hypothetical protein
MPDAVCVNIPAESHRPRFLPTLAAIVFVAPPTRRILYVRLAKSLTYANKVCYLSRMIASLD